MGTVYVANPSSTKVLWQVNGGQLPAGWPAKVGGPPLMVSAALVKYPAGGQFGPGDNLVAVQFSDEEGPGYAFTLRVPLPPKISLDGDLIVYVFRGYAVLLDQAGYVLSTAGVPVPPPPDPGPQAAG